MGGDANLFMVASGRASSIKLGQIDHAELPIVVTPSIECSG